MRRRPLHCVCVCACVPLESGATNQAPYSLAPQLGLRTPLMPISQIPCVVWLRSPADEHQQIGAGELSCAPPSYRCCA
ncbi:hypothetical protein K456DRAFT_45631 [Colletotrichum gloeosporioides 23]|nr:hypothetical protein K456DRAFT_45631 [Colletotrichum gloeosporioides 23]